MAAVMPCNGPDDQPSVFLIQNIADVEVMTFCLGCMLDFSQALLQQFAPERLAPPPAKPGRKRQAKPAAAMADDSKGGEINQYSGSETARAPQGIGQGNS